MNAVSQATAERANLTELLNQWSRGDRDALDNLLPLVYDEIKRIAHRYVRRERNSQTLQTTALVHEAYLRLAGTKNIEWQNRAHFFAGEVVESRDCQWFVVKNCRQRIHPRLTFEGKRAATIS